MQGEMTAGDHGKPTAQWVWLIAAVAGMLLSAATGEPSAMAAEQGVAPSRSVVVPGFWDPRRRPERDRKSVV
jgi:hypothetical protein